MSRNRSATERKLLGAALEVLVERGPAGFGVNAVAAQAGVDKVLIYRYFADLAGMLGRLAVHTPFFPPPQRYVFPELAGPERLARFLRGVAEDLGNRPVTLKVMAWSELEGNPLTEAYRAARAAFWRESAAALGLRGAVAEAALGVLSEATEAAALQCGKAVGGAVAVILREHEQRVAVLAEALGEKLGLPEATEPGARGAREEMMAGLPHPESLLPGFEPLEVVTAKTAEDYELPANLL